MLTKKEIFDLFGNYNYQFAVVLFLVDCKGRVFLWLTNGKKRVSHLKKIKQPDVASSVRHETKPLPIKTAAVSS